MLIYLIPHLHVPISDGICTIYILFGSDCPTEHFFYFKLKWHLVSIELNRGPVPNSVCYALQLADVMDYSLLVGIDEEKKELVIGIIDYLRQYTWDKQLETWVKASGILGGPKNESPTVISPIQYKKRFRKAMSKYFLTVPDQWSS